MLAVPLLTTEPADSRTGANALLSELTEQHLKVHTLDAAPHNQDKAQIADALAACGRSSHKWCLILDEDARLHPSFVAELQRTTCELPPSWQLRLPEPLLGSSSGSRQRHFGRLCRRGTHN